MRHTLHVVRRQWLLWRYLGNNIYACLVCSSRVGKLLRAPLKTAMASRPPSLNIIIIIIIIIVVVFGFFFLPLLFFLSFLGYFSVKVPFSLIWGLTADLPGFTGRWGIIQSRRKVLKVEVPVTISLLPIFMEPCTCDLKNLRLERKHLHVVLFFLFTQMNPKPTQRVLVLRFSVTKEPLVLYQFPGISLRVMVATQPAMCLQCLVTSLSQLERIPSLLPLNLSQTT